MSPPPAAGSGVQAEIEQQREPFAAGAAPGTSGPSGQALGVQEGAALPPGGCLTLEERRGTSLPYASAGPSRGALHSTSQGSAKTFTSLLNGLLGGRTVVPNLLLKLLSEFSESQKDEEWGVV